MRFLIALSFVSVLFSCSQPIELKTGTWRGVIQLQGQELPFTFLVEKKGNGHQAYLQNATEKLLLDEISIEGDSVKMKLHIFDASLSAKIDGDQLIGTFVKNYNTEGNLPFAATWGQNYRFAKTTESQSPNFTGTYQLEFQSEKETYPAVGIFDQKGNYVVGTFLTPTGDYRYLEGNVIDGQLKLSTFDGNHAFVFSANLEGDSLKGDFYSGHASHEVLKGIKNEKATLPNAESLTFLKEGFDKITFSFPDVEHNMISPSDEKFENKVLILQIFGTWCPNCMDETKFLTQWYKENKDRGVEIVGLAYERKADFDYASERVKKMKDKLQVPYDFVIAGTNDKEKAAETLTMLNKVIAFPTTIFIGKDGKVKHIRTGFEGPGTGIYYEQFKERFNQMVNELLAEKI
jgi:thiol-disulfide isomerase/thioredoxin